MNTMTRLSFLLGTFLTGSAVLAHNGEVETERVKTAFVSISTTNQPASAAITNTLPPLPPGVTELKFNEFFRQPIGPRGLEDTDKLRALDGQRIRILGYMVRQEQPVPRGFMIAPQPISLHEDEFGLCDDLPAALLHVFTDATAPEETPYTPGLLLLTGKLSVGNRTEIDGRISTVRLQLDPPTPEQQLAAAQAADAVAKQKSSRPDSHAGHHH
jgi:hypothetical protein